MCKSVSTLSCKVFLLIASFLLQQLPLPAQTRQVRRVLIFNDLSTLAAPGTAAIDHAIHEILNASPYQIELYNESLETTLFPDQDSQRRIRDWYIRKYEERKPDVIIAVGPSSLQFMIESHEKSFPDVPIIFCGTAQELAGQIDGHFTGAHGVTEHAVTIDVALRLRPGTRNVVVIGGVGTIDKSFQSALRQSLEKYQSKLHVSYLTELTMPALLERVSQLPANTIVLYTSLTLDAAGRRFISSAQAIPLIVRSANAPVFVTSDVNVGTGAVGGYVLSWAALGRAAAAQAVQILNGRKIGDIPITKPPNHHLFDARALKRWGINESDLPPGTTLLNQEISVWQMYKWYILAGTSLILAQTGLILQMFFLRARRKKMQSELIVTNDRLRLAMEGGNFVGWDWDIKTGRDYLFGDLQTMFGIAADKYEGTVENFLGRVHRQDRAVVGKTVQDAKQRRTPYILEFRVVRDDGQVRWITARGKFYYSSAGEAERMVGMAVDTTHRRQTEEALRKSEEKFSKAFRHSPMSLSITTARDNRYVDVNDTFLEMTGWSREEVIGRTPIELGLWVQPEQREVMGNRLLSGQVVRNVEFKSRTKHGEIRSRLRSMELIEIHGEECVLAVTADITELKKAESILRESEERFRLAANTAPVMIWMTDPDKLCTFINQRWIEFTGRSLETEIGYGWIESIHPNDVRASIDTYTKAFDARESFAMEYRLRRSDGEYRFVLDSGAPRYNADGSFAGYTGSVVDITQHKLAEEVLSMVSRKLIEAHEEERTWIARELHDDISQGFVFLMLNLERLKAGGSLSVEFKDGIGKALQQATELCNDIRALSYRLHSSKLEYLGLASAMEDYCAELADQHSVQIERRLENMPRELSKEVSLCIFRVLQEALRNAIKHSGAQHFRVSLRRESDEIILIVHDSGAGFDPGAMNGRRLGLTSMKERLKLVDGKLSIESEPDRGTTVQVRAPLILQATAARWKG